VYILYKYMTLTIFMLINFYITLNRFEFPFVYQVKRRVAGHSKTIKEGDGMCKNKEAEGDKTVKGYEK